MAAKHRALQLDPDNLDYSSEMLALCGKIAALYGQGFADPAVLDAVNDVENLTSGLSRKIWQKLIVLHNSVDHERQFSKTTKRPPPTDAPCLGKKID